MRKCFLIPALSLSFLFQLSWNKLKQKILAQMAQPTMKIHVVGEEQTVAIEIAKNHQNLLWKTTPQNKLKRLQSELSYYNSIYQKFIY